MKKILPVLSFDEFIKSMEHTTEKRYIDGNAYYISAVNPFTRKHEYQFKRVKNRSLGLYLKQNMKSLKEWYDGVRANYPESVEVYALPKRDIPNQKGQIYILDTSGVIQRVTVWQNSNTGCYSILGFDWDKIESYLPKQK